MYIKQRITNLQSLNIIVLVRKHVKIHSDVRNTHANLYYYFRHSLLMPIHESGSIQYDGVVFSLFEFGIHQHERMFNRKRICLEALFKYIIRNKEILHEFLRELGSLTSISVPRSISLRNSDLSE